MNPSGTSRPVMDVSAPRPSQAPGASSSDQIAVRPAPAGTALPKVPQPSHPAIAAAKPKPAEARAAVQSRTGAPVGIITIAVLAMMLLSAAAVVVYATSQTA